jgi:hypothetical protein
LANREFEDIEKDFSAQEALSPARARFSETHEHARRGAGHQGATAQGQEAAGANRPKADSLSGGAPMVR